MTKTYEKWKEFFTYYYDDLDCFSVRANFWEQLPRETFEKWKHQLEGIGWNKVSVSNHALQAALFNNNQVMRCEEVTFIMRALLEKPEA